MGTVGVRELKQDASRILRRVREEGESFDVTYHGKVIAKLVPVEDAESRLRSFDEFIAEWDALTADDPDMPVGNYAVESVRESRRRIE
jgi:prevent-host-death family protein